MFLPKKQVFQGYKKGSVLGDSQFCMENYYAV